MDRRDTLKWILAASASPLLRPSPSAATAGLGAGVAAAAPGAGAAKAVRPEVAATGYGSDPDLLKHYRPGDVWPLVLTPAQRHTLNVLCDLIIPADEHSPSASAVGVVDFIDEWVSAPYPQQRRDRSVIEAGLEWLDGESKRRFAVGFAAAKPGDQAALCDDICDAARAAETYTEAAAFFARCRDLTAGGFYSTPVGFRDVGYVGNAPLTRFDGPPPELLRKLGLDA